MGKVRITENCREWKRHKFWLSFRDNDIPSGWSSRGGQTVSAYVLEADPSGSSTGSAVSISANMAAVSLGTETDGSIISPSARGGLVGLKPTFGSVSTKGVIPLTISYDVVGIAFFGYFKIWLTFCGLGWSYDSNGSRCCYTNESYIGHGFERMRCGR